MPRARSTRRLPLVLALAVMSAFLLAGCGDDSDATPTAAAGATAGASEEGAADEPVQTTDADWADVAKELGRPGTLSGGTVYRVGFARSDLPVTSQGVRIAPGFALGSYAAFARYPDMTLVMGDLVVTEKELPQVTSALQRNGLAQTAVHQHLLDHSPAVWWTHYEGENSDPAALARAIRAVLDRTATPQAAPAPASPAPVDLDTAGIDTALGATGKADGGIYKFTFTRPETVTMDGHVIPPGMGVTTAINFQPTGKGKAAINGDFVMVGEEVQKVIQALRDGGIDIVEVHQHFLDEQPRLIFMHFWANDDAVTLAKALAAAVAANHVRPAA